MKPSSNKALIFRLTALTCCVLAFSSCSDTAKLEAELAELKTSEVALRAECETISDQVTATKAALQEAKDQQNSPTGVKTQITRLQIQLNQLNETNMSVASQLMSFTEYVATYQTYHHID